MRSLPLPGLDTSANHSISYENISVETNQTRGHPDFTTSASNKNPFENVRALQIQRLWGLLVRLASLEFSEQIREIDG